KLCCSGEGAQGNARVIHVGEKKGLEEELDKLQLAMAPAEDEPESVRGLTTRARLVERIQQLGEGVFK
ncbi:hypothetical protein A2U01_0118505, partial [Trifolium medium]|nr:hypothetical protein [Trifolium medium]